jgi:hypothetical protein
MDDPQPQPPGLSLELPPGPAQSLALAIKIAERVLQENVRKVAAKGITPSGLLSVLGHLEMIQKVMGPFPGMVEKHLSFQEMSTEMHFAVPEPEGAVSWTILISGIAFPAKPAHNSPIGDAMEFIGPRPVNFPDKAVLIRSEANVSMEKWIMLGLVSQGKYLTSRSIIPAG